MNTTIIFFILFLIYFLCNKSIKNNKIHSISKDSFNCLKGIMAVAVVLHHLAQRTDIYLINSFFLDFGPIAVSCFFFISGYGLIASYEAKGNSYLTGFLSKRVRKLITPFLFAIILFQLIYTQNLDIIYCFSTGNVDSILPFSWYVFCAILFYFIFYYVFKYIKSEIKGILWIFIITCSLSVMLAFVIDYPPHWWKSLFFFPMGAFVKNAEKILIGKKVLSVFYIMLAIILTIALLIILNNYEVKHTIYIAVRLCPLIYILALMIINISFNLLKWLGNISYEIYLVQGIVFYSLQRFIHEDLYFIILSLISIIVLAFIMKYILNKWDILIYKIFKLSPK